MAPPAHPWLFTQALAQARCRLTDTASMDCCSWVAWNRTQDLVDLGYTSARTARMWKQKRRLPTWAAGWIQLIANGDLGRIDPTWSNWIIRRGELVSPDGWCFGPAEVKTIPFRHQKISLLERRVEILEQQRETLQALILEWMTYLATHGLEAPAHLQIEAQKLLAPDQS